MKRIQCSRCGRQAVIERGNYVFKESGLKGAVLVGIQIARCPHCGNTDPIIPAVNDLMRALALAVVRKPYRLAGEEIRFLRKFLNKSGEEFGRLIGVDKTTLSKWENNDDPVGEQSDRLVRLVVLGLDENLRENASEAISHFPEISSRVRPLRVHVDTRTLNYQYA